MDDGRGSADGDVDRRAVPTLNWFPDESEEARVALASRALRQLHAEKLIVLRDAATETELSDGEVDTLLSGDE